ncbi:MAG: hypothetical protein OQK69_12705 [Gammaproteobacteria bacterium]|nr:hypothetical protein [Gammaproteobacteria bacterium]
MRLPRPWKDQAINVDEVWLVNALGEKISSVVWMDAKVDVERFLKPVEQKSLSLWGERFFASKLAQLYK